LIGHADLAVMHRPDDRRHLHVSGRQREPDVRAAALGSLP
jgi:hypothetical protein